MMMLWLVWLQETLSQVGMSGNVCQTETKAVFRRKAGMFQEMTCDVTGCGLPTDIIVGTHVGLSVFPAAGVYCKNQRAKRLHIYSGERPLGSCQFKVIKRPSKPLESLLLHKQDHVPHKTVSRAPDQARFKSCLPVKLAVRANDGDAVFIREFTLIRRDHLPEEPLSDSSQKPEDPNLYGEQVPRRIRLFAREEYRRSAACCLGSCVLHVAPEQHTATDLLELFYGKHLGLSPTQRMKQSQPGVEPQANEQHFSQSVLDWSLNDLTGIMIGDEFTVEELLLYLISQWDAIDDGVMDGRSRWCVCMRAWVEEEV
ncbi:hypothetical protein PAMP_015637 [Pampus punctatissimus]